MDFWHYSSFHTASCVFSLRDFLCALGLLLFLANFVPVIFCHFESGSVCHTAYLIHTFLKLVLIKGASIGAKTLHPLHYL